MPEKIGPIIIIVLFNGLRLFFVAMSCSSKGDKTVILSSDPDISIVESLSDEAVQDDERKL